MKQINTFCLILFVCLPTVSANTVSQLQQNVIEDCNLFGLCNKNEEMPVTDIDRRFLQQVLKENHIYQRRGLTEIHALVKSTSHFILEKNADFTSTIEQGWDSYILYNDGYKIIEFRNYYPSHVFSSETKAGFKIKGLQGVRDYLNELKRKNGKNSITGTIAGQLSKVTGGEWTGKQARKKLESEGVLAFMEPTLFSNTQYLIVYDFSNQYPEQIIRLGLDGNNYIEWRATHNEQNKAEEFRQSAILRSAYIVDRAILPAGKPAKRGDQWYVNANVFGDIIGLKSARQIDKTTGTIKFSRSSENISIGGHEQAVLRVIGKPIANKITVQTLPKHVETGTKETIDFYFLPNNGYVFWDFEDQQISLIELQGKVLLHRYHEIDWLPDKFASLQPTFKSRFTSTVESNNFTNQPEKKQTIKTLLSIINKYFPDIGDKIESRLNKEST